jgi:alpha-1,6-mannosyltransferase
LRSAPQITAAGVWLLAMTASFCLDDPRRRFMGQLLCMALAGVAWLVLLRQPPRWAPWLGLLPHGLAIFAAPAFSEDVFRYIYEGRTVWTMGPAFPFAVSPADAPAAGVPGPLLDEAWLRINHPELPTLYPPGAQLAFALAAMSPIGPLFTLKSLNAGAALGAAVLLERRGWHGWVWVWLCPLVVIEGVREVHVDGLTLLFGAWAASAWRCDRPLRGHAGFALSALCKVAGGLGLVVGGRRDPRGLGLGLAVALLMAWPVFVLGLEGARGGLAYAGRWQGGEGVYGLFELGARALLGGDWARLGGLTVTAQQLARAAVATVFGLAMSLRLRRRPSPAEVPVWTGQLLIAALLLSPTLHPWYLLGILPFAAAGAWPACAALLCALAPALHYPSWVALHTGVWEPALWPRLLVHGAAGAALLGLWWRNREQRRVTR